MKKKHNRILTFSGVWFSILTAIGMMVLANTVSADNPKLNREFNDRGNILIADQFNNRVIEINPAGKIVWSFGRGPNDFSASSVIGVNDAQRVGRLHPDGRHWHTSGGDSAGSRRGAGQPCHAGGSLR